MTYRGFARDLLLVVAALNVAVAVDVPRYWWANGLAAVACVWFAWKAHCASYDS